MNYLKFKNISWVVIVISFILIAIIGGIMASLSILKDEALDAHMRVIKLQSNTFSNHLEQNINSLNLMINSQAALWVSKQNKEDLQKQFVVLLKNSPYIRSINLLENSSVVASSNPNNINIFVDISNFYPKPFLNQSILRVGRAFKGRDLDEMLLSTLLDSNISNNHSFLPIIKKIQANDKNYHILIALNPEYFINTYLSHVDSFTHIDILRIDDIVLASSDIKISSINSKKSNKILTLAKEKNRASGVTSFNNEPYIVSYSLNKEFPFTLAVRANYEESFKGWENKRYYFFIITTAIVIVCILLVLFLLFLYNKANLEEIKRHKLQVKSNKKFKVLFESHHFISAIIEKNGTIKELNKKALCILNQTFKQASNTPFWSLSCFNQEDQKWLKETILNYSSKRDIKREFTLTNALKEEVIIDFMIIPIDIFNSNELMLLSSDITQRKKYEYKIKEAYTVFQNTHDGIVITDKNANILNVNKAFETVSKYTVKCKGKIHQ